MEEKGAYPRAGRGLIRSANGKEDAVAERVLELMQWKMCRISLRRKRAQYWDAKAVGPARSKALGCMHKNFVSSSLSASIDMSG